MNYKNLSISGLGISSICLCVMNFEAPLNEIFPLADQAPKYYAGISKWGLKND